MEEMGSDEAPWLGKIGGGEADGTIIVKADDQGYYVYDGACCNDGFGDDWQGVDPFVCNLYVEGNFLVIGDLKWLENCNECYVTSLA